MEELGFYVICQGFPGKVTSKSSYLYTRLVYPIPFTVVLLCTSFLLSTVSLTILFSLCNNSPIPIIILLAGLVFLLSVNTTTVHYKYTTRERSESRSNYYITYVSLLTSRQ
jgi:hypothetical protein